MLGLGLFFPIMWHCLVNPKRLMQIIWTFRKEGKEGTDRWCCWQPDFVPEQRHLQARSLGGTGPTRQTLPLIVLLQQSHLVGFPGGLVVKNPPALWRHRFSPWVWITWRRKWQPTPVFLPGKSHGEKTLGRGVVFYSLWGRGASHDWAHTNHPSSSVLNHWVMECTHLPTKLTF